MLYSWSPAIEFSLYSFKILPELKQVAGVQCSIRTVTTVTSVSVSELGGGQVETWGWEMGPSPHTTGAARRSQGEFITFNWTSHALQETSRVEIS